MKFYLTIINLKITTLILSLAGFILGGAACLFGVYLIGAFLLAEPPAGQPLTATIISIAEGLDDPANLKYRPATVRYDYQGQTLEGILPWYSTAMAMGREITIRIDPENPVHIFPLEKADKSSLWLGPLIIFLSCPWFILGAIGLYKPLNRRKRLKRLRLAGRKIEAEIKEIRQVKHFTINGYKPYVIVCSQTEFVDGPTLFTSHYYWHEPKEILLKSGLKTLPVYCDPDNPQNYVFDLSILDKCRKVLGIKNDVPVLSRIKH